MPSPNDFPESNDDHPEESNNERSAEDALTDPRMNDEYVRRLPDAGVTLVGVVHDHPASVHRAREVVRERDPDVVALEAPPLAMPLYETYARESRTPPTFGGEMSAAAQAAREEDAEVVGIDGPTVAFF